MKRILKWVGVIFAILILLGIVLAWIKSEPLPAGENGQAANEHAEKMLKAMNSEAYAQTRYLEWSFRGGKNHYRWDKKLGICHIRWEDYKVVLNLNNLEKSEATKAHQPLEPDKKMEVVEKALEYFNNDSFWLVAPYKVFDKGTERSLVELENGEKGLLVTYQEGGSTPGDSYLWLLNDNGFPNSFKMWVGVIPIGGVEASWDNWLVTESGAFLPKTHQFGPMEFDMGNVRGYN
ncbi:hypothetical protein [Croceivirga thetidis]|uniref:Uncharacterized protein n=1 Tax=Croceivirga thetidis TaxID=2721623 RepID=A0ABX1GUI5_9FLAO|nr:hypothetical protein [Croceivirga thetidis]NKI32412.1 hypothetical protein [Croceivirga thetidis]